VELPTDYLMDGVGGMVTFERKSTSDFVSSLHDGRLFDQIAKVRQMLPMAKHSMLIHEN
jgi:ERCC4-type nuclease